MNEFIKIKPVIVYPYCLKNGLKQDCFKCELYFKDICKSPRGLCVKKYYDKKKGCPNYNNPTHPLCPPNAPMYDEIFNINKDIYLIYTTYNLGDHIRKMKERHPDWSERALRNVYYWQGTDRKFHREEIKRFMDLYKDLNYVAVTPEGLGVDVDATLKNVGITLPWPPEEISYRVSFAAEPLDNNFFLQLKK